MNRQRADRYVWLLTAPAMAVWIAGFAVALVCALGTAIWTSDRGATAIQDAAVQTTAVQTGAVQTGAQQTGARQTGARQTGARQTSAIETIPVLSAARDPVFFQAIRNTLFLCGVLTLGCVSIAYIACWCLWRLPPWLRNVLLTLLVLPKLVNVLATVYGLRWILTDLGPLNQLLQSSGLSTSPIRWTGSMPGVVLVEIVLLVPYSIVALSAGFARLDKRMLQLARGLGASPFDVWWRIELPLTLPAVAATTLLTGALAMGAFLGPQLFGAPEHRTLPVDLFVQLYEYHAAQRAAVDACALLVIGLGLLAIWSTAARVAPRWLNASTEPQRT